MTADSIPIPAQPPRGGYGPLILIAVVASLGSLLFGFDTVVISGANEVLKVAFDLRPKGLGFTVAIGIIGTIAGVFLVGKPSDWLGRKNMLFFVAICYLVSSLGCGLARNWYEFLAARFLGGVAVGATSLVTPMYIAEISPPNVRGRLVMINQFNIVLGVLLCGVSNYVVAICCPSEASAWRWMLGILALPSAIFFLLVIPIPESPRWLVMKGRMEDARKTLRRLGETDIEGKLAAIRATFVRPLAPFAGTAVRGPALAANPLGRDRGNFQSAHRHQRHPVLFRHDPSQWRGLARTSRSGSRSPWPARCSCSRLPRCLSSIGWGGGSC